LDGIQKRLISSVGIAANQIDGDALLTLTRPADQANPAYPQILGLEKKIVSLGVGITNIYTMRKDPQGQIFFVVDGSPVPAALGDPYTDASPKLVQNFSRMTGAIVEDSFYTDQWGTWFSGYAPVYGSNGKPVGVLGMDISAGDVVAQERQLLWTSLITGLISSVLVGFLCYFLTRSVVNPIKLVTEIANRLSIGDSSLPEAIRSRLDRVKTRKDELGAICQAFETMIVYQDDLATAATAIAGGDLTQAIEIKSSQDRLGVAFKNMSANLKSMISEVSGHTQMLNEVSGQLATAVLEAGAATGQIGAIVQQVAEGVNQQTGGVNETVTSVGRMTHSIEGLAHGAQKQAQAVGRAAEITSQLSQAIQKVSSSARAVAEGSANAADVARVGAQAVTASLEGLGAIQTKVNLSAQKVEEMGSHTEKIGMIVETIADIAAQTNLLALNAAIEAARAGEHGKGFGVVADEVRKLAERSAVATREITDLVKGIQQSVQEAVTTMQAGSAEMETGFGQARQSGRALEEVQKVVENVNSQIAEIARSVERMNGLSGELVEVTDTVHNVVEQNSAATDRLAAGSNEVTRAIENIACVSEENYAAVEEVSGSIAEVREQVQAVNASAQSLSEMAEVLQGVMAQFKLDQDPMDVLNSSTEKKLEIHPSIAAIDPRTAMLNGNRLTWAAARQP
jgi:methyl-accepting chemotaxis protein